jgi:SAM-dependent methyltransferase
MSSTLVLRAEDGAALALDPERWHGGLSHAEARLLSSLEGPVLDVGCGPGRLLVGLGRRGVAALGIDPAPGAAAEARRRGATVLQRSVFEPVPAEGRWMTVLLMDGNVGIGGDPVRLLRRCGALTDPSGAIVVETHRPGAGIRTHRARLEHAGQTGPWFRWAEVGADAINELGTEAGLEVERIERSTEEDRWFAFLRMPGQARDAA